MNANDGDFREACTTPRWNGQNGNEYCAVHLALHDVDGDTLIDIVVGTQAGRLLFFRNTGTSTLPHWTKQLGDDNPFKGDSASPGIYTGGYATPAFFDFDGDGTKELVLGSGGGTIRVFAIDQPCTPEVSCSGSGICLPATPLKVARISQSWIAAARQALPAS